MSIACPRIRTGLTAGVLAIVALAPQGLAGTEHKETRQLTATHMVHSPISVDTSNGSISIRTHEGADVQVTARLRSKSAERLAGARVGLERDKNGKLTIGCDWPGGKPKDGDGCSFEVLVPDAFGVNADTSNGSITIADLSGELVADTSNGSITVDRHAGSINADTSNGSIHITDVTGEVKADTSNGSISVALADENPGPVDLDTSNGSIKLEVGSAFVGSVSGETSLGRASIGTFPESMGVEVVERDKTSFRAVFGGKNAPKSVLDTSVGSVTVQARS